MLTTGKPALYDTSLAIAGWPPELSAEKEKAFVSLRMSKMERPLYMEIPRG